MNDIVERIKSILLTENVANVPFDKFLKKNNYNQELNYILSVTSWMNSDTKFYTRTTYAINDLHDYIKCCICGKEIYSDIRPVWYKHDEKVIFSNTNECLCKNCRKQYPAKQSNTAKAIRWARGEKDPYLKSRILEIGSNFYDDSYINNWAINFKLQHDRKPTKEDFRLFFGRKFPRKSLNRHFNMELFSLWDSYLELKVCDYLNELGYMEKYSVEACQKVTDYVRNSMFKLNGKYYQLDIYFPLISVAIEVEDFTTHSKDSDVEPYKQRPEEYKHGPTYHDAKRNAANSIGIFLFELWEDSIRDKSFMETLNKWLNPII